MLRSLTNCLLAMIAGQASLWSEQASPEVVDAFIWPRAAAVSEVWWLGEQGINGKGLNATSALARLHDFRYRLVRQISVCLG